MSVFFLVLAFLFSFSLAAISPPSDCTSGNKIIFNDSGSGGNLLTSGSSVTIGVGISSGFVLDYMDSREKRLCWQFSANGSYKVEFGTVNLRMSEYFIVYDSPGMSNPADYYAFGYG